MGVRRRYGGLVTIRFSGTDADIQNGTVMRLSTSGATDSSSLENRKDSLT